MDLAIVYSRLVPGFKVRGCFQDGSIVWHDNRPMPTQAECEAEWLVYEAEQEALESDTNAYEAHNEALGAGYEHTDGLVYHCSERATGDYCKIVTLFDLDPSEPVYITLFDGTLHSLSYANFKTMAIAVGRYQYQLRQALWAALA